jgi:Leu/Phe-tRNA-protein transferase
LKQTYARVSGRMRGFETWDDDKRIGGSLGIVVHTAYHLGEIRQALCSLK